MFTLPAALRRHRPRSAWTIAAFAGAVTALALAAGPTQTQAAPATGTVESVIVKDSKPDAAKPWRKWGVTIDGQTYGTFDRKLGDLAVSLDGKAVLLEYTTDGKYMTVSAITPAEQEAPAEVDPRDALITEVQKHKAKKGAASFAAACKRCGVAVEGWEALEESDLQGLVTELTV